MLGSPRPLLRRRGAPAPAAAAAVLAVAAAVALGLSGCSAPGSGPGGSAAPSAGPSAEASAPADGDGQSEASATPSPEPEPEPFEVGCDELLTAEQVYAFNPNFGTDPDYEPAGAWVVAAADAGGTACGWLNQTSGEVLEVAVAKPGDAPLEQAGNRAAASSNAVPTYGTPPAVEGYFDHSGRDGTAQVITGPYWIVVQSPALFEPGDAERLVAAVIGNLPPA